MTTPPPMCDDPECIFCRARRVMELAIKEEQGNTTHGFYLLTTAASFFAVNTPMSQTDFLRVMANAYTRAVKLFAETDTKAEEEATAAVDQLLAKIMAQHKDGGTET